MNFVLSDSIMFCMSLFQKKAALLLIAKNNVTDKMAEICSLQACLWLNIPVNIFGDATKEKAQLHMFSDTGGKVSC